MGAVLVLVAVFLVLVMRATKKRREEMAMVAEALGWGFQPHRFSLKGKPYARLPLLRRGSFGTNALLKEGEAVSFFDFTYVVHTGKSSQAVIQTVALFQSEGDLPRFSLRPEHFGDRIASKLGWKDIDFEDEEDFSNAYFLKGKDESAVRSLFNWHLRDHLSREQGWSLEGEGHWVLIYRHGKRASPGDYARFIEATETLFGYLEKSTL